MMSRAAKSSGFSLIEVLVTMLILMCGLLGLAGLQGVALTTQMEAYQRSQAIILVKDMANRINANRTNSTSYVTTSLGTGSALGTDCTGLIGKDLDFCEWNNALQGSAEVKGGNKIGAMIGARGCIYETVSAVPRQYLIAVAWQGINRTAAPAGVDCGQDQYGNENLRRVVTFPLTIAKLD